MSEEKGRWITTDKGIHVFIREGETVEQALYERFDNDEFVMKKASPGKYGKNLAGAINEAEKDIENANLDELAEKYQLTDEEKQKLTNRINKKLNKITHEEESFDNEELTDEELGERDFNKYWLLDEKFSKEWGEESYDAVSKEEYEKAMAEGKKGHTQDLKNRFPENIEDIVKESLEQIKSIDSKNDFFRKLGRQLYSNDVNEDHEVLKQAFKKEITEHYNSLIKDKIDSINSIDAKNSISIFTESKSFNRCSPELQNNLKKMFDNSLDDNLKPFVAIVANKIGTKFYNDDNDSDGTYYAPLYNRINFRNHHLDTASLYHECMHSVYENYKIGKDGLQELMTKESKGFISKVIDHFLPEDKEEFYRVDKRHREYVNKIKKLDVWSRGRGDVIREYEQDELIYESMLSKLNYNMRDYPSMSDMLEAASKGRYGFGHGKKYWAGKNDTQADEFFAEMAEMKSIGANDEIKLVKEFFPETSKKYEKIMNRLYKNKGELYDLWKTNY